MEERRFLTNPPIYAIVTLFYGRSELSHRVNEILATCRHAPRAPHDSYKPYLLNANYSACQLCEFLWSVWISC